MSEGIILLQIEDLRWKVRQKAFLLDGGRRHARTSEKLRSQARELLHAWQHALHSEGAAIRELREYGVGENRIEALYPLTEIRDWGVDLEDLWHKPLLRARLDRNATRVKWRRLAIGARAVLYQHEHLTPLELSHLNVAAKDHPPTIGDFFRLATTTLTLAADPLAKFNLNTRALTRYLNYLRRLTPLLVR